jgi:hypothetical protein
MLSAVFAGGVLFTLAAQSVAQDPLPSVDGLDVPAFQHDCRQLLLRLQGSSHPVPAETLRRLKTLVDREDPASAETLQKLLDAHCLIAVTINPESRVKAARGPAPARLMKDRPTVALVKVVNEGGVTHALAVSGPQLRSAGAQDPVHWLEAKVSLPMQKSLTGRKIEYVLLELTAHAEGKREATLRFDVGQGTQDLGFRAEVPVLFTIGVPGSRASR